MGGERKSRDSAKTKYESPAQYNAMLKKLHIRQREQILQKMLKTVSDMNIRQIRAIQNSIELLQDKQGNIVIRLKKRLPMRASILKQHNTTSTPTNKGKVSRLKNTKHSAQRLQPMAREFSPSSTDRENRGEDVKLCISGVKGTGKKLLESPSMGKNDSYVKMQDETDAPLRLELSNYVSHKPPTTIKIIHKDYDHLVNHEINQAIGLINRFICMAFKNKETVYDVDAIFKMSKAMKLPLAKKAINATTFKNRDTVYVLKEQITKYLSSIINRSNEFNIPESSAKATQFKFFVGKGNNAIMVRSILKQRWWWGYCPRNDENLNLLWTQWYKPKFIADLPCHHAEPGKEEPCATSEKTSLLEPEPVAGKKSKAAPGVMKISNHMERHYHLSNKKAMFINLQRYYQVQGEDPFATLPLTFHIREGVTDPEFAKFTEYYKKIEDIIKEKKKTKVQDGDPKGKKTERNVWIIKPGEYSNRGCRICVMQDYTEIKHYLSTGGKRPHTYILQKYIEKPLLINKRKFDIRIYGLLTSINGHIKGYFYDEGYIRTSCKEYTLKNLSNKAIHLTNDAVQQKLEEYGKYEPGNKLSFADLQKYLDATYPTLNIDYLRDIHPQVKV